MTATEVAIVGGGVAGCATAYYLAEHGVACTVVERDGIAAHASGFAYGGLNPLSGAGIPGPMAPLAHWAFALHRGLEEALAEPGPRPGYRRRDVVQLAFSAAEAEGLASEQRRLAAVDGFRATLLDGPAARNLEPRLAPDIQAALVIEGTAEVDAAALARTLAATSGAVLLLDEATGLIGHGARATGVRTRRGMVPCQAVVLAPGPWRGVGPALPIAPLKGEILRLRTAAPPLEQSIGWNGNYATTKPDGLVWAGTTEDHAGLDARPSAAAKEAILARLRRMLPGLTVDGAVAHTACLRPMSADGLAVIGRLPTWENVYLAGGGGRKGVLYGPALGLATAQLVVAGNADFDLSAFAPSRFG